MTAAHPPGHQLPQWPQSQNHATLGAVRVPRLPCVPPTQIIQNLLGALKVSGGGGQARKGPPVQPHASAGAGHYIPRPKGGMAMAH